MEPIRSNANLRAVAIAATKRAHKASRLHTDQANNAASLPFGDTRKLDLDHKASLLFDAWSTLNDIAAHLRRLAGITEEQAK